jgi:hypothetical protein
MLHYQHIFVAEYGRLVGVITTRAVAKAVDKSKKASVPGHTNQTTRNVIESSFGRLRETELLVSHHEEPTAADALAESAAAAAAAVAAAEAEAEAADPDKEEMGGVGGEVWDDTDASPAFASIPEEKHSPEQETASEKDGTSDATRVSSFHAMESRLRHRHESHPDNNGTFL